MPQMAASTLARATLAAAMQVRIHLPKAVSSCLCKRLHGMKDMLGSIGGSMPRNRLKAKVNYNLSGLSKTPQVPEASCGLIADAIGLNLDAVCAMSHFDDGRHHLEKS